MDHRLYHNENNIQLKLNNHENVIYENLWNTTKVVHSWNIAFTV